MRVLFSFFSYDKRRLVQGSKERSSSAMYILKKVFKNEVSRKIEVGRCLAMLTALLYLALDYV